MKYSDTERLDWLIRNSCTWNSLCQTNDGRSIGGCWDDGSPNYGAGGDSITPEGFTDPREAIDTALNLEREAEAKANAIQVQVEGLTRL